MKTLTRPEPDDVTWMTSGLCSQTDPELFYPEKGQPGDAAKQVCGGCPHQIRCLQHALTHDERHGIWGGTTPRERQRLLVRLSSNAA